MNLIYEAARKRRDIYISIFVDPFCGAFIIETAAKKSSASAIITGWTKQFFGNLTDLLFSTKFNPSIRLGKLQSMKHLSL